MTEEKKRSKPEDIISLVLSVIFHPAFLPVYGLLIILGAPTFISFIPFNIKRVMFLLAAVNMTVVPLALMPFLRYKGVISSYSVENRVERVIPLGIGSIMYIITTFIFYSYQIPIIIKSFMIGVSITSFLVLVITFRWKISLHAAGTGGLLATIMALSIRLATDLVMLWLPMVVICGLVMSARLLAGSHSPAQVYAGFLAGFLSLFITMIII